MNNGHNGCGGTEGARLGHLSHLQSADGETEAQYAPTTASSSSTLLALKCGPHRLSIPGWGVLVE